jgi:hypothetical protein
MMTLPAYLLQLAKRCSSPQGFLVILIFIGACSPWRHGAQSKAVIIEKLSRFDKFLEF